MEDALSSGASSTRKIPPVSHAAAKRFQDEPSALLLLEHRAEHVWLALARNAKAPSSKRSVPFERERIAVA